MPGSAIDRLRFTAGLAVAGALLGYGLTVEQGLSDGRWLALLALAWLAGAIACWPRLPKSAQPFPRTAAQVVFVLVSLFMLVTVQLVRYQVFDREAIASRTGGDIATGDTIGNPRAIDASLAATRGAIYDRDGILIAGVEVIDGVGYRTYPNPDTAYVAGYYSPLQYGFAGLEATWDDELSGRASGSPGRDALDGLLHRDKEGSDLTLTLDGDLQALAHDLLAGRTGAVVLLDVRTGATLVLASEPHVDPASLVAVTIDERDQAAVYWQSLIDDPRAPLVLRATGGRYTPGSTFKTVTAAAALAGGIATPGSVYIDDGSIEIDGRVIPENNRPDDTVDEWTLAEGYGYSLNVVFARVGLAVGPDRLTSTAESFGFDGAPPYDLPVAESQVANDPDFLDDDVALAETSFGQGQLLATPLQMAMVAACVANDGVMMRPYLVAGVISPDGDVVWEAEPEVWRRPISGQVAGDLQGLMVGAVETGYVGGAAIPGAIVGGKTGTAETGDGEPHSWFIGWAGDEGGEPRFAVAVVLEHGGAQTSQAVAIGQQMLAAALSQPD